MITWLILDVTSTQHTASVSTPKNCTPKHINVDSQTKIFHDTALTIACNGGHEDLVKYLLVQRANIEHRDIRYYTPLMIAASNGFHTIVEILLNNKCKIEAHSNKTKDTALILACFGNHYKVWVIL